MRKNLFFVTLAIFLSFSFSLKKEKKFIPPGTVQISDTLFVDEVEIYNFAWQEYENWAKAKFGIGSKEHLASIPDTLVWRQKISDNEPYVHYYYRHPAYKDHPVVGISYEQALAFCKWRTDRVKEFYFTKNKKEINIEYRLPTKQEWELISNGTEMFADGGIKNGEVMFNHRYMSDSASRKYYEEHGSYQDVTTTAYSYYQNKFGVFCIFGNVAEMVSEKGISKGGSWRNLFEECRPENDLPYTEPTAWLGFRCVCVISK